MSWTTIGAEDESLSLVGCARSRMTVPSPRHTPTGKDIAALCPSQVRASPALSFPDLQQPLSGRSTTFVLPQRRGVRKNFHFVERPLFYCTGFVAKPMKPSSFKISFLFMCFAVPF